MGPQEGAASRDGAARRPSLGPERLSHRRWSSRSTISCRVDRTYGDVSRETLQSNRSAAPRGQLCRRSMLHHCAVRGRCPCDVPARTHSRSEDLTRGVRQATGVAVPSRQTGYIGRFHVKHADDTDRGDRGGLWGGSDWTVLAGPQSFSSRVRDCLQGGRPCSGLARRMSSVLLEPGVDATGSVRVLA